jgi:hypothetical protein
MDKVICIQDGTNNHFSGRPHISRGEIYHVLDVFPHTEFGEEATQHNVASGDWYEFVEIPYCHWSGLFKKLEYDEQLEDEYNDKIQNSRS